jgi:hypothetical protein
MSAVTNIWRQLVQRRLWPVAIVLVVALAAVPLTLAKDPEPQPPAPLAQVDTKSELATTPIVAPATPSDRAKRRRVLGTKKNPFAVPKATAAQTAGPGTSNGPGMSVPDVPASKGPDTPAAVTAPDAGGSPSFGGGGTTPPAADPTPAPARKRYQAEELTVRFGGGDDMSRMSVKKLEPVPVGEEPLVLYLGVADGGKSAVFLIDSSVEADGDGECMPDPNTCETVHVREGETEFFDVVDDAGTTVSQYQLDLVDIKRRKTASASVAKRANARESKAGRKLLRLHQRESGPLRYRYDAGAGTVQRLGAKAWKAVVAKAARAAKSR